MMVGGVLLLLLGVFLLLSLRASRYKLEERPGEAEPIGSLSVMLGGRSYESSPYMCWPLIVCLILYLKAWPVACDGLREAHQPSGVR